MSNKGLSKHTLSNYSKKKSKLPRYISKDYIELKLLPNRSIKHKKYDSRSGYKLIDNYLKSKLGCVWDEVYSELKTKMGNFDCNIHVETNVVIKENKVYYYFKGSLSELCPGSFYVDLEGLLQQVCKNKQTWNKVPDLIVIKIDDNHEYRYLEKSYWNKAGWYYYCKNVTKEVKKKLVIKDGKPVFYNRLNCKILDPMLLGTLMFTYETVEKVTWEKYPISDWGGNANYYRLKLLKQGVVV